MRLCKVQAIYDFLYIYIWHRNLPWCPGSNRKTQVDPEIPKVDEQVPKVHPDVPEVNAYVTEFDSEVPEIDS